VGLAPPPARGQELALEQVVRVELVEVGNDSVKLRRIALENFYFQAAAGSLVQGNHF